MTPDANFMISPAVSSEDYIDERLKNEQPSRDPNVPFTISEFCALLKNEIDKVKNIRLIGEISNLNERSDYVFFSLKDESAIINCMAPRNVVNHSKLKLEIGLKVLVFGNTSFYMQRGSVSFICRNIAYAGEGDNKQKIERILQNLYEEGFYRPTEKKPLPQIITKVAVITSKEGQALKDVINTIKHRNPFIDIYIVDALVQGKNAPQSIMNAIYQVDLLQDKMHFDVLLLVRGGGASEDLEAFNDLSLNKYVSYCRIPVISGVGHQGDFTVIDYMADQRAATPTQAAMMVSRDINDLIAKYRILVQNLFNYFDYGFKYKEGLVSHYNKQLEALDPIKNIEHKRTYLDSLNEALQSSIITNLNNQRERLLLTDKELNKLSPLDFIYQKNLLLKNFKNNLVSLNLELLNQRKLALSDNENLIKALSPLQNINDASFKINLLKEKLISQINLKLKESKERLGIGIASLSAQNPLKLLEKGYSITTFEGKALKDAREVAKGDIIETKLQEGTILSKVTKIIEMDIN